MKKQLELNIYKGNNGGPRPGAGRPRKHSKGVSHLKREKVTAHTPLHINFKFKTHIRTPGMLKNLEKACENAKIFAFNVTHFTLQSNHIHLIAEAKNNKTLEQGMRSITNTLVELLKLGSIQVERYHLHVLRTPKEVENALKYVLQNDIKHTGKISGKYTRAIDHPDSWLLKTLF